MRLADVTDPAAVDGKTIALPRALLRGDARLETLFAPFGECVVLHESLAQKNVTARATRLLVAELRDDRFDEIRDVVRGVCPKAAFEEKPTELDDVAAGSEWRERSGALSVSLYRLFGGSTSLHASSTELDRPEAPVEALAGSPLAILAEVVSATSFVERVSCARNAGEAPRWHLQAALRDLRRFEEIAPRLAALGFEERRGKWWRERIIVQPFGKDRWMAALPGIDFGR